MARGWSPALDSQCTQLAARICDDSAAAPARADAWRALLVVIAPHVERWAAQDPLLRRCRLTSEDDPRGVLVGVLTRLQAANHANLRAYLAQRAPELRPPDVEDEVIAAIGRLAASDGDDDGDDDAPSDPTAFEAWLRTMTHYAVRDHVRSRLGWRAPGDRAVGSKRDVGTDAGRLDDVPEQGRRPAVTDYLALSAFVSEVEGTVAGFPHELRRAFALWMRDHDYQDIARTMSLEGPAAARKLVRAASARLRHKYRERWSALFLEGARRSRA